MTTDDSTPRTIEIPLSNGYVAIVSEQDADLMLVIWDNHNGYASTYLGMGWNLTKNIFMHCVVMQRITGSAITESYQVDHVNRNRLDNRRENLRLATIAQNTRNKGLTASNQSGFKGVYLHNKRNWAASITVNYKTIYLGVYDTPEDAAVAYNHAAKKHFGDFAYFNPIDDWELKTPERFKQHKTISGYSGVYYDKRSRKWQVKLYVGGNEISVGYYETAELGYEARCLIMKEYTKDN